MATRTTKTPECDKGACRKRSGVRQIEITITVWPKPEDNPIVSTEPGVAVEPEITTRKGELCSNHIELAKRQATSLFQNTKNYD